MQSCNILSLQSLLNILRIIELPLNLKMQIKEEKSEKIKQYPANNLRDGQCAVIVLPHVLCIGVRSKFTRIINNMLTGCCMKTLVVTVTVDYWLRFVQCSQFVVEIFMKKLKTAT